MPKPKPDTGARSDGAPLPPAPGIRPGAGDSSAADGLIPLLAVDGATAVSINGREYAVDAEGFIAVHPADVDLLRAHGALR